MRISTATTLVCSTLATVAVYQGFAALFPHLAHPDDDSTANAKKDSTNVDETATSTQPKRAIAAPERMPAISIDARTGMPAGAGQLIASTQSSSVPLRKLPKVNVPPALRSLTPSSARSFNTTSISTASNVATPETMPARDGDLDFNNQVPPATPDPGSLPDVKGHWAQGYIESLAVKGIVQGFVDGRFHPDEPVTARQFAMMTEKAFQVSPVSFNDLQQSKGDRVPTRADAAVLIYQTLAKAGPAPVATAVQISGAVPRPGIYAVPSGDATVRPEVGLPTVTQAIQQAGGALAGADLRQVQIHRVNDVTEREVINVNVAQMLKTGDRHHDLVLHQGDRLFIPAATTAASSQQVTSPLPQPAHAISLAEHTK